MHGRIVKGDQIQYGIPAQEKISYSVRQITAAESARMRTASGHFIGCSNCLPAIF